MSMEELQTVLEEIDIWLQEYCIAEDFDEVERTVEIREKFLDYYESKGSC